MYVLSSQLQLQKIEKLRQINVCNAFLHSDLDEEAYIKLPLGFTSNTLGITCHLKKSLYGLHQALKCWFAKLATSLKKYEFTQSYLDYSFFTLHHGQVQLNVLVYVDDLIISSNVCYYFILIKKYLGEHFYMKDLGILKYFLSIEVAQNLEGIFLCQRNYTLDIISDMGLFRS